jgi:hypothetical protein
MPSHDAQLRGSPRIALIMASSIEEARIDAATLLDVPASELALTLLEHHRVGILGVGGDEYKIEDRWTPPPAPPEVASARDDDQRPVTFVRAMAAVGAAPAVLSCKRGRISLAVSRPGPGKRPAVRSDIDWMLSGLQIRPLTPTRLMRSFERQTGARGSSPRCRSTSRRSRTLITIRSPVLSPPTTCTRGSCHGRAVQSRLRQ